MSDERLAIAIYLLGEAERTLLDGSTVDAAVLLHAALEILRGGMGHA